ALQVLADLEQAGSVPLAPAQGPERALGELGDFRLLREEGRGGMGVVYEAVQLSLNRRVALKVLPFAATLDDRQIQRFTNGAPPAAHLHASHIAPVYPVGRERGVYSSAMHFIHGLPLAALIHQMLGRTPRPEGEATGPFVPAAPAAPGDAPTQGVAGLSTQHP